LKNGVCCQFCIGKTMFFCWKCLAPFCAIFAENGALCFLRKTFVFPVQNWQRTLVFKSSMGFNCAAFWVCLCRFVATMLIRHWCELIGAAALPAAGRFWLHGLLAFVSRSPAMDCHLEFISTVGESSLRGCKVTNSSVERCQQQHNGMLASELNSCGQSTKKATSMNQVLGDALGTLPKQNNPIHYRTLWIHICDDLYNSIMKPRSTTRCKP
jgi:hypothetical protein